MLDLAKEKKNFSRTAKTGFSELVPNQLYVKREISNEAKMRLLRQVLDACDIDRREISFHIIEGTAENEDSF